MTSHVQTVASRRKQRTFRILALLLGLFAGTLLATLFVCLRAYLFPSTQWIYLAESGHELSGHRYIYDSTLGWKNIPNWKGKTFGRSISINSKGLRDREYTYRKPAETTRILVLGDSYAWGYGVSNNEIFTEVMEDDFFSGANCQVLNSGVSGWGTDQQYLFLKHEGFRYEPDIVVVSFFFMNDFENISYSQQYGLEKPLFINKSLEAANVPVPKPSTDVIHRRQISPVPSMDLAIAIISRMALDCRQHNCQLVLFKFGTYLDPLALKAFNAAKDTPAQNFNKSARANSTIFGKELAQIKNLHYLDIDKAFEAKGFTYEQLRKDNHDYHWNTFAHRQIALELAAFLQRQGLIDFYQPPQPKN